MNLKEILKQKGFKSVYKILSKEVFIFEKRMETLLFVKYLGKDKCIILKKNKSPITLVDKILNPEYKKAEEHFNSIRYLKKFKGYKFKIGFSEDRQVLYHVNDGGIRTFDSDTLNEYSKILKLDPIEPLYKGTLNSNQKNEIIQNHIEEPSNLAGIFTSSETGKRDYYTFNPKAKKTIPKDLNVIIVNHFMNFIDSVDTIIKFDSDKLDKRYVQLMNSYIYQYLYKNINNLKGIEFDTPNYRISEEFIDKPILRLFEDHPEFIVVYKILLSTFNKNITSRGLYTKNDISNIKEVINKINLKIKGLDFANLIN